MSPGREPTCSPKERYVTLPEALAVQPDPKQIYRCPHCDGYHIGAK